jgi:hypothetical protein
MNNTESNFYGEQRRAKNNPKSKWFKKKKNIGHPLKAFGLL